MDHTARRFAAALTSRAPPPRKDHNPMSDWTLTIENLRALRRVEFRPPSLCAIVGENGAGKSTLLMVFRFLRRAFALGLHSALAYVLSTQNLKHWDASDHEDVKIQIDFDDGLSWKIIFTKKGGFIEHHEQLTKNKEIIVNRTANELIYRGNQIALDGDKLAIHVIASMGVPLGTPKDNEIEKALQTVAKFFSFGDLDVVSIKENGSNVAHSHILDARAKNAITLLRKWSQSRPDKDRYKFVLEGLQYSFPHIVSDLDFDEAGQTIVLRIFPPGRENPSPIAFEANGLVTMLLLLCILAQANDGEVIAIDEPENGLHPYAQRQFIEIATQWAEQKQLSLVLATHSTTMLDVLKPEQVFVLQPNRGLTRADVMHDPKWLSRFRLGELYKNGELGSNDDPPTPPTT